MKGSNITRLLAAATFGLLIAGLSAAAADSLFKDPVIAVSPRAIDFGLVPPHTTVTNSILIENWGGGKLVGKATVPRPFKIVSGASYRLRAPDAQILTIIYTPSGKGLDTNVVKFTGGGGAFVPITGSSTEKKEQP